MASCHPQRNGALTAPLPLLRSAAVRRHRMSTSAGRAAGGALAPRARRNTGKLRVAARCCAVRRRPACQWRACRACSRAHSRAKPDECERDGRRAAQLGDHFSSATNKTRYGPLVFGTKHPPAPALARRPVPRGVFVSAGNARQLGGPGGSREVRNASHRHRSAATAAHAGTPPAEPCSVVSRDPTRTRKDMQGRQSPTGHGTRRHAPERPNGPG